MTPRKKKKPDSLPAPAKRQNKAPQPKRPSVEGSSTNRRSSSRTKKSERRGYSEIVMLGTGCPHPDPRRSGPSLAIVVNDRPYLVDFGPGIVRRTAAAYEQGVRGLAVHRLDRAFLTHLHSDHTAGYPDLILTPWVCGRETTLQVYGPPGLQSMTDHLLAAYAADIDQRLHGLEPAHPTGYQVTASEVVPGKIYEDENVEVHAFEVWHGTWTAYGYKFICPDRTIVVSGDTCKHENVIAAARGCDVLIHEVCSGEGVQGRSPEWREYHSRYHTLGFELAEIASEARPGLLILTHQLFQGVSESELLREVRRGYDGPVISAKDLDVF